MDAKNKGPKSILKQINKHLIFKLLSTQWLGPRFEYCGLRDLSKATQEICCNSRNRAKILCFNRKLAMFYLSAVIPTRKLNQGSHCI